MGHVFGLVSFGLTYGRNRICEILAGVIRLRRMVIPRLSKPYFKYKGKGAIYENSTVNLLEYLKK